MQETMELIQKMSKERRTLWYKASHGGLSPAEVNRLKELTDKIYTAWDTYRREFATGNSHRNLAYINFNPGHAA